MPSTAHPKLTFVNKHFPSNEHLGHASSANECVSMTKVNSACTGNEMFVYLSGFCACCLVHPTCPRDSSRCRLSSSNGNTHQHKSCPTPKPSTLPSAAHPKLTFANKHCPSLKDLGHASSADECVSMTKVNYVCTGNEMLIYPSGLCACCLVHSTCPGDSSSYRPSSSNGNTCKKKSVSLRNLRYFHLHAHQIILPSLFNLPNQQSPQ